MNADDPLVAKLARFTPTAGELDRDELLFRAGRASVRPARGWKVACLFLGLCQCLLLAAGTLVYPRRHVEPPTTPTASSPRTEPEPPPESPRRPGQTVVLFSDPDRLPPLPTAEPSSGRLMSVTSYDQVFTH